MSENIYSKERKELQEQGLIPDWMSTGSWQIYKQKYLYNADNVREQYHRIADTLARHVEGKYPAWWDEVFPGGAYQWKDAFFDILWRGDLSPSTPVQANTGTDRGCSVSCSGGFVPDSVQGFYRSYLESAMLTKEGFGTSAYLGAIRPRGSKISKGGKASGAFPVFKHFVEDARDVAQGSARRGAWAGSIEITHNDWDEIANFVAEQPDDVNAGWLITDEFVEALKAGEKDAVRRWNKAMKLKMTLGKGYFTFIDKINRKRPQMYVDKGLKVKASNLCQEITLFADDDHTFTCVLSSLNLKNYRTWMPMAIFISTVFLDCVAEEFILRGKTIPELEKAVRFTEKGRALGLGVMGLHTLFQQEMMPFGSMEAHYLNIEIFRRLREESLEASQWLAEVLGEPEWCKGYGVRNTHRLAIAPTKSTSLIMGGVSEGINPDPAMTFTQTTAAGEIDRINPVLLDLMKSKGVYSRKTLQEIVDAQGSVQGVSWLTDEEKAVFRTAFEISPWDILRLASARQKYLDQMQSLNLFFSADEDEEFIAEVHKQAFLDENILSLYYCYSRRGVMASKDCEACQ